ncbi:MAG TPA: phytanoyl-CoA dioxygenase family protein [Chitinophagaceae bacterium]|nr:phytanoyl-CoA dioxygenase family protein [Chitinophagaceae bacterium]
MISETEKQLALNFREDGYIFIPGFLNENELSAVTSHLKEMIQKKVPAMPPEHAFYEDRNDLTTLKQIQTLFTYDPFFHEMMFNSRFEKLAELLLNDGVVGKNMQYFNKPPKVGMPTPPHQDGYYFMLEPNEAVTIWLGLDDVDEENGCVRYAKGSHLKGLRPHAKTQTLGFSQGISDYGPDDENQEIWFKTKPGDLLAHHSLTIHRADNNKSDARTRRALGFIYYAQKAKENREAKEKYQQKLAEEIRNQAK